MNEDIIMRHNDPKSIVREAYRTIRTNIQFSAIDKALKTIVVTSSIEEEGKTTVSINLAYFISESDKRVILIDSDMRRPMVHNVFELPNLSGLTTVLTENIDYRLLIQPINNEKLDILTSGPIPPNPPELLGSKRMQLFLERLKEDYDMVILDSPPAGLVTDAVVLSSIADGTILVCAAGKTESTVIKTTKQALDKVNANIIGVVMNKVPLKNSKYYSYY
ncbi:MAG: capsular biosynthesis protein [Clostridia bacterium]|nr:capsular biosynthesis protein [Clostridia bacterium]